MYHCVYIYISSAQLSL